MCVCACVLMVIGLLIDLWTDSVKGENIRLALSGTDQPVSLSVCAYRYLFLSFLFPPWCVCVCVYQVLCYCLNELIR